MKLPLSMVLEYQYYNGVPVRWFLTTLLRKLCCRKLCCWKLCCIKLCCRKLCCRCSNVQSTALWAKLVCLWPLCTTSNVLSATSSTKLSAHPPWMTTIAFQGLSNGPISSNPSSCPSGSTRGILFTTTWAQNALSHASLELKTLCHIKRRVQVGVWGSRGGGVLQGQGQQEGKFPQWGAYSGLILAWLAGPANEWWIPFGWFINSLQTHKTSSSSGSPKSKQLRSPHGTADPVWNRGHPHCSTGVVVYKVGPSICGS